MVYVIALTIPIVALELVIDDRTVRLAPLLILLPAFPAAIGTVRQTIYAVGWVLIVITGVLIYRPLPSWYDFVIVMVLAATLGALGVQHEQDRQQHGHQECSQSHGDEHARRGASSLPSGHRFS